MAKIALPQKARWAALGAAFAVVLGAGGIGISQAVVSTGERSVLVPITPCRLADTRSTEAVGTRATPIGPGETFTLAARGINGNCNIAAGATALSLNITAFNPTIDTFLTVFPTGALMPLTSNLNPKPGQPPTPNAVTVDLNATGQFDIFNLGGTVDVIVDVVGFYEDHNHDDRYYTKAQTDAKVAAVVPGSNSVGSAQIQNDSVALIDLQSTTSDVTLSFSGSILAGACLTRAPGDGNFTGGGPFAGGKFIVATFVTVVPDNLHLFPGTTKTLSSGVGVAPIQFCNSGTGFVLPSSITLRITTFG